MASIWDIPLRVLDKRKSRRQPGPPGNKRGSGFHRDAPGGRAGEGRAAPRHRPGPPGNKRGSGFHRDAPGGRAGEGRAAPRHRPGPPALHSYRDGLLYWAGEAFRAPEGTTCLNTPIPPITCSRLLAVDTGIAPEENNKRKNTSL
ncbi:hypothetical protein Bbelb_385360 [Branchiostoma belcheri]|nr:hypothetical protein Bbelb_385360 [Branchiostoma belcheri]